MGEWQKWHPGTALSMKLGGGTLQMWCFRAVRFTYRLCHCTFIRKLSAAVFCFFTQVRETLETLTWFSESLSRKVIRNLFSVQYHWVIIARLVPASLCSLATHRHVGTSNGSMASGWQVGDMMSSEECRDMCMQINDLSFWLFLTFTCCLSSQRESFSLSIFTVCFHGSSKSSPFSPPQRRCSVFSWIHFCSACSNTLCLRRGRWKCLQKDLTVLSRPCKNKGPEKVPVLQGSTNPVLDPSLYGVFVVGAHWYINAVLRHAADWCPSWL